MDVVATRCTVYSLLSFAKTIHSYASKHMVGFACMSTLYLFPSCGIAQGLSKNPVLAKYDSRVVVGWKVHVHEQLPREMPKETKLAINLLEKQLDVLVKTLPKEPLTQLRTVPLWFSPQYDGFRPGAEYHPNAGWLRRNGRPEEFAKCVEFTNVRIFERECVRMPMLALHELAHAYHDQFLGFENKAVISAFKEAEDSGKYDNVERWHGTHRKNTTEKAYAMSNHKEYFAETSEAFFGRNDFFPFTREQLQRHDPKVTELLAELWKVDSK